MLSTQSIEVYVTRKISAAYLLLSTTFYFKMYKKAERVTEHAFIQSHTWKRDQAGDIYYYIHRKLKVFKNWGSTRSFSNIVNDMSQ